MRNRFAGKCNLCGCDVPPKTGYWHAEYSVKASQNFSGLRCIPCGTTTKKGNKLTAIRLAKLTS
jgi:hypothetical protein